PPRHLHSFPTRRSSDVSHPLARQLRQYRQSAQCSGARRSRSWCRDGALRWRRACGRDGTLWSLWRAAAPDPGSRARLSAAALFPAAAARLVSAAAPAVGTVVAPVAAVLVVVRSRTGGSKELKRTLHRARRGKALPLGRL